MIAKQVIQVEVVMPFSLKNRLHILFGKSLKTIAFVEVTAVANLRHKEVKITHEYKGVQSYLGVMDVEKRLQ